MARLGFCSPETSTPVQNLRAFPLTTRALHRRVRVSAIRPHTSFTVFERYGRARARRLGLERFVWLPLAPEERYRLRRFGPIRVIPGRTPSLYFAMVRPIKSEMMTQTHPPASHGHRAEVLTPARTRAAGFEHRIQATRSSPPDDGVKTLPIPSVELSLKAKQSLFHEALPATRLFEVVSGALAISKLLSDGRHQLIEIVTPGWVCGFSSGGFYDASCEALVASRVRAFQRSDFDNAEHDLTRRRVFDQVERQVCALHGHALLLGRKSPKEALATVLLRLLPARGVPDCVGRAIPNDQVEILLPLSRKQISDYLGLSNETVSRTVTELANEGYVRRTRKGRDRLVISDVCKLCRLANGSCVRDNL